MSEEGGILMPLLSHLRIHSINHTGIAKTAGEKGEGRKYNFHLTVYTVKPAISGLIRMKSPGMSHKF